MAKLQDIELQDFLDAFEQRMGGSFGGGSSSSGKNKNTAKGKNSSKSGGVLENFTKTINNLSFATRSLFNVTKNLLAPWAEVDQAAANFSKNIGLSAKGLENLRKTSIRFVKEGNLGALFDVSAQELIKLQEDYAKAVGRNVTMGREAIEYLAASTKLEGSTEMITKMENFGISMKDAGERVGKIYANSTKHGIAWAKMAKTINENFDIAQNYNFSKGQKAFYKMAEKAAEINLDMKQTAAFADKFSTIEGAIEGSANLQVLGGAFARMASNPLELMRKSLMAPDELQDDIIKTFGSFGSYDTEKGEFKMDWTSRERVKEAAKATGMDYSNVMGMIQNNARREAIGKALEYNPNNFDEDTIRLIKNVGVMQNGRAGLFDKDGKFVKAQNLTTREIEELAALQQSDSDNLKDIVADLRGVKDILSGTDKQIKNKFAEKGEDWRIGDITKNILVKIGETNRWVSMIALAQAGGIVAGGLRGIGRVGGSSGGSGGVFGGIKGAYAKAVELNAIDKMSSAHKLSNSYKASRIMHAAAKSGRASAVISGLVSGVITGYEEFLTDNNHSTGKKIGRTTGSVLGGGLGTWGGAAGGAALGAMIGSIIPGLGTAIGAAVGTAIGSIGGGIGGSALGKWIGGGFSSDKRRNKFRNELGLTELKGDYSVKELREIKNAISNHGVISDKLQEKIDKNQDKDIIEEIRQRPVGVNVENWPEKMGGRHAFGGIVKGPGSGTSDSIPTWLSNGESVMTAKATKMFGPELSVMNRLSGGSGDFGSIKPNVAGLNAGMIDVKAPSPSMNKISPSMGGTVGGTININFSPIKIEFPNGTNKDITNDLLSNPVFMRDLTKKIEEGLIRSGNGGHLIVRQGNKFV